MPGCCEVQSRLSQAVPAWRRDAVTPVPGLSRTCAGTKHPAFTKFSHEYQGIPDKGAFLCRDATKVKQLEEAHFPGVEQQCGAFVPARHEGIINLGWGRPPEALREMTRFSGGQGQGGLEEGRPCRPHCRGRPIPVYGHFISECSNMWTNKPQ